MHTQCNGIRVKDDLYDCLYLTFHSFMYFVSKATTVCNANNTRTGQHGTKNALT